MAGPMLLAGTTLRCSLLRLDIVTLSCPCSPSLLSLLHTMESLPSLKQRKFQCVWRSYIGSKKIFQFFWKFSNLRVKGLIAVFSDLLLTLLQLTNNICLDIWSQKRLQASEGKQTGKNICVICGWSWNTHGQLNNGSPKYGVLIL